ncbi:MAG: hypothetical protein LC685_04435, partial [Actinobacteria bacterium]|nr:hypothetical protein [Actinomycetota bacterium]
MPWWAWLLIACYVACYAAAFRAVYKGVKDDPDDPDGIITLGFMAVLVLPFVAPFMPFVLIAEWE